MVQPLWVMLSQVSQRGVEDGLRRENPNKNTGNAGIYYEPKALSYSGFDFSRVSETNSFLLEYKTDNQMLIHLYCLALSLFSRLLSSVVGQPLGSVVGRHDPLRLVWNASCSCELQVWSWSAPVLVSSQLLVDNSSLDPYSAPFDSPFRIWSLHPVGTLPYLLQEVSRAFSF